MEKSKEDSNGEEMPNRCNLYRSNVFIIIRQNFDLKRLHGNKDLSSEMYLSSNQCRVLDI